MKKLLTFLSCVAFCITLNGMDEKETESKEKMLEYDLFRWQMWFEYGAKLDRPAYLYWSEEGKFIGSRPPSTPAEEIALQKRIEKFGPAHREYQRCIAERNEQLRKAEIGMAIKK